MRKFLLIVTLFNSLILSAQYNFAIGIRAGGTSGITFKSFNSAGNTLEGILGFCGDCFSITGLFEKNREINNTNGLSWFYGGGAHIAFYEDDRWFSERNYDDDGALGFGVDGIIGIEYKIPEVPLAFSLDFKPFVEITTRNNFLFWLDPGLGVKFAF